MMKKVYNSPLFESVEIRAVGVIMTSPEVEPGSVAEKQRGGLSSKTPTF